MYVYGARLLVQLRKNVLLRQLRQIPVLAVSRVVNLLATDNDLCRYQLIFQRRND